jgi:GntR family transcriptional regulator / MocR family aminotransferase
MVRSTRSPIRLDPKKPEPLFKQIFDQIAARIQAGAFPADYRLPPTRELAKELGTHRNTVVRAYEELEAAGFVNSIVGRGTFVAAQFAPEAAAFDRRRELPGMPWRTLLSKAAQVEPLGRFDRLSHPAVSDDIINLNRMQPSPDLLPAELLQRCIEHVLRTLGPKALGYAPREGVARLRLLISEDLLRQGVPAHAEDVIITTGSQQALDMLSRALINPGDQFLVDASTYSGALNLISAAGANVIGVPSDDEGPDMAFLERLERSGAKGFYLMPNCHNPTGRSISHDRREALIEWSHRANVPLIEDDYGEGLSLDGEPAPPALRAFDSEVIYTGTFSKKLIPALRIGFMVVPAALRPLLVPLKQAMDLGTSALLQHALAEFLDRGYLRAHVSKTLPEYRRRRDALEEGLAAHLPRGLKWRHPDRGVVLWLPLPGSIDPEQLYLEGMRRGVLVGPSTLNNVDGHKLPGVRLTFCAEAPERLREGAKRLAQALKSFIQEPHRAPELAREQPRPALEMV